MPSSAHFTPQVFEFLSELEANNTRAWFEANRERYLLYVKEPFLRFIADFAPQLGKLSRNYTADPRPVGGSFFRIHRDVRFSPDKSPYKTFAAAQFRHIQAKDVHAPGFYLHLQPGECFAGAGIWHPDGPTLSAIREALVEKPRRFDAAVAKPEFQRGWKLSGDSLQRPPRGFDPAHRLINELKRKDHVAVARLTEDEICSPRFLASMATRYQATVPYIRFLTEAAGLPF